MFNLFNLFANKMSDIDPAGFDPTAYEGKAEQIDLAKAVEIKKRNPEDVYLLDVRTKPEFNQAHVEGSEHLDVMALFNKLPDKYEEDKLFLVYCNTGGSSMQAQQILEQKGYRAINAGGIIGYQGKILRK